MPRSLKAYTYELSESPIPNDVLETLKEKSAVRQARILVFSTAAKHAYDILVNLGLRPFFEKKLPKIAYGNDVDALVDAGYGENGEVFVVGTHGAVAYVHFDTSYIGSRTSTLIGEIDFRSKTLMVVED